MSPAEIEKIVDQVILENPESIQDYKSGKIQIRALGFLAGAVIKLTQGKASPKLVSELLRKKLQ